jgi:hypothetical protein
MQFLCDFFVMIQLVVDKTTFTIRLSLILDLVEYILV